MTFRTDLAVESTVLQAGDFPPGIQQHSREFDHISLQYVKIETSEGAEKIGKPQGTYITITTPPFHETVEMTEEEIAVIAREIENMLPPQGLVLVVGLGNNDITPDAIGPRTIHQVIATRHIDAQVAEQVGLEGLRAAAALAPGVLGQTGIETSQIVHAVVQDIQPAAVIVVDALASRSAARLGCTIQIASSGISPGSGVMNARKELSKATLGIPVISVGIPTVVDASTLAGDLLQVEDDISWEQRRQLFEPRGQSMMITPREIDVLIGRACKTLALAINKALQPDMTLEEIGYLAN